MIESLSKIKGGLDSRNISYRSDVFDYLFYYFALILDQCIGIGQETVF